jgi:hypothetical protein
MIWLYQLDETVDFAGMMDSREMSSETMIEAAEASVWVDYVRSAEASKGSQEW